MMARRKNTMTEKVLPFSLGLQADPDHVTAFPEVPDYGKIIRKYRQKLGLEQGQLAALIDRKASAVSNWENGINRPDMDAVGRLCVVLKLPPDILFGLPHESSLTASETDVLQKYRVLNQYNRRSVRRLMSAMIDGEAKERMAKLKKDFIGLPQEEEKRRFIGLPQEALPASAGTGMSLDSIEPSELVYVRNSREAYMADELIQVSGDSMTPTYHDGDMLFVQNASELLPGEIGIFVVGGDSYVKEYQRDGLHSHNPKYATIHPSEDDNAHCIGRVIGVVDEKDFATPEETNILTELDQEDEDD